MAIGDVLTILEGDDAASIVQGFAPPSGAVLVSGASGRASCRVATTTVLPGTPTYVNGSSGVGATLTEIGFGALTIDGVTIALNDRVLVKNQAAPAQNGIYYQSILGTALINYVLTRSTDYDQSTDIFEGTFTVIEEGTANTGTAWQQTTSGTITVGTTAVVFAVLKGEAVSVATPAAVGTAAAGTSTTKSNDDHVHNTGASTPSTQAFGDSAATGTGPAAAMTDHKHAMPANPVAYAAPALTLGTSNSAGAAASAVRTDATILAFDATTPAAVGTAAVGAATVAARRDHVHATGAGTPSTQAFGDAASTGNGPAASMTDHKHAMPASPWLPFISGGVRYYPVSFGPPSNNQADSLNLLQAAPFFVPVTTTFDRIMVTCTGTVATAVARLGIYNDGGGKPGTLLLDAGQIAAASGGDKPITISQSLTGGTWYWLACVGQTAAPNLAHALGSPWGLMGTTNGFNVPFVAAYAQTGITGALPSPWGATLTEQVRTPLIYLRPA